MSKEATSATRFIAVKSLTQSEYQTKRMKEMCHI